MEFSPVPAEELHKSGMELDPVVLLCHVSREDAEVVWSVTKMKIPLHIFFFFLIKNDFVVVNFWLI